MILPKLRTDLERREQETGQGRVLVIKDPVRGEFFSLGEAEHFIAQQLDGTTSVDTVRARVAEKFQAEIGEDELRAFVQTLEQNRLLETEQTKCERHRKQKRPRFRGNLLYLRFRAFDPDALLTRMLGPLRFCYTPQFIVSSACTIFLALAIAILNWEDILHEAAGLYHFSTLTLLIPIVCAVVTAHEFAHGLTCKHFGGEVREMGFMLVYLQPAFYCNVSDAWFFRKRQRLWVSFAGPYFELFIWATATLLWRLVDTGTWTARICLIVMATSGIKTLFNFNPLIKLDGYYLLSDYLGIANLRRKSFRYLGDCFRTLGGLFGKLPNLLPRERRVYLVYGVTAWIGSCALLGYVAYALGGHLIAEQQRLAFLAFTGLVGAKFRMRFRRLFARDSVPKKTPAKRGRMKWIVAAVFALLLFVVRMDLRVAGAINVLPIHNADVRAEVDGIVEEIFVDEGQSVKAGDPIARLMDRDVRAELAKTEAQVDESRARLKLLEAGAREEELEVARTSVARAQEQLKFYRERMERFKMLNDQQLASMLDFEESQRRVAAAESDLAESEKKLQLMLAGTRPEEIEALRATIASLEAQRRHLAEQVELMTVLSPAEGVVTTPSRELKTMSHQLVHKGDLIAKVYDFKTITAEIAVSEKEIADVRTGQSVALKVRAYPERVFPGTVTEIATTAVGAASSTPPNAAGQKTVAPAETTRSANTILVTTEIDNREGLLKPGMTGMAKISCGSRRIVDLITRRLSRTFRVEFWSWW